MTLTNQQHTTTPIKQRRGCFSIIIRGIMGVIILVIGLLATAFVIESILQSGDAVRYPPLGQIVDVEGYNAHIYCTGEGSPTVILEAGAGGMSVQQIPLQAQLEADSRVCVYDRAGMGWSAARPEPRTAWQIAHELHTLLSNANIEPPYVLVGASNGGLYVRAFAADYPDDTAGLVLLDPTYEATLADTQGLSSGVYIFFGRLGIFRLFASTMCPTCEADGAAAMGAFRGHAITWETYEAEWTALQQTDQITLMSERLGQAGVLGDMPLVVIAANQSGVPLPEAPADYQASIEAEQAATVILSTNYRYNIVMSDHGLSDQSELIVQSIRDVLTAARTGEPLSVR